MAKPQLRDPRREPFWRRTFRSWQAGGLGVRAFCAERGLAESAFYFWRQELRRRDAAARPAFVPVTVVPVPAAVTVEVRCPSGHTVVLGGADESTLKALFAALRPEAPPC